MNVTINRETTVSDGFDLQNYEFSVDWLNVRLDTDNLSLVISKICAIFPEIDIQDFVKRPSGGVCFYNNGYYLATCGYSSVVLSYETDEYGCIVKEATGRGNLYGILVSVSGDGCRFINSLQDNGMYKFIKALECFHPHCTRIDVAMDIFDENNVIAPIIQEFCDCAYSEVKSIDLNCNLQRKPGWVTANLVYDHVVCDFTRNVTIGGHSSKKGTLQFYNKREEILQGRHSLYSDALLNAKGDPLYWWRLEYRCKSFAQYVFDTLLSSGSIYSAFLCAVRHMGDFSIPLYSYNGLTTSSEDCLAWLSFINWLEELNGNNTLFESNSIVSVPYITDILDRNRAFNKGLVNSYVLHCLQLALDPEYKKEFVALCLQHLYCDTKLKKGLFELRRRYCYEADSAINDLYAQMSWDDCF